MVQRKVLLRFGVNDFTVELSMKFESVCSI
jgi:hypothetical protein